MNEENGDKEWVRRTKPIALSSVLTALVNSGSGECDSARDGSKEEMFPLVPLRSKYAHW